MRGFRHPQDAGTYRPAAPRADGPAPDCHGSTSISSPFTPRPGLTRVPLGKDFDTIVIGSGAGGLSAALCLAKAGQRVLVLEQHYVPGGWCHSFYLDGHRFSPGVHYLGMLAKGEPFRNLYESLGIANDLVFFRMNSSAYEHCWIGDERIDMPAGMDALYESLSRRFPSERDGLHAYLDAVRRVSRQLQLLPRADGTFAKVMLLFQIGSLFKYGLFSLKTVLERQVRDPLLRKVLSVQCGDHGLPPSRVSFLLHSAIMDHYLDGAYYPAGGGGAIVKALTNAIRARGGEVRTARPVKSIVLEGGRPWKAVGVALESGEIIRSRQVVSNADPETTYTTMIGHQFLSRSLRRKLRTTRYSVASLSLYLTVDIDVAAAGMDSGNIWMLRDQDVEQTFAELEEGDISDSEEFPALFVSCTTLKDPTSYDGRHHTIEAVTYIGHGPFEQFAAQQEYRTDRYVEYKARLCEKFLRSLERIVPGIGGHIVRMELGTPLNNAFYINATKGSVFGTEKSFRQTGAFSYARRSEIEGLFLCGASVLAHGVAGATYSGMQTAATMLDQPLNALLRTERGQNLRIFDAEERSGWPEWIHAKIARRSRSVLRDAVD